MKLIANRQLHNPGLYGTVAEGHEFNCTDEEVAKDLIRNDLARKAEPPRILYETKVIVPPEVGPAVPFRDMPVPDKKPEAVVAASDPVLSESNLSEPGAADSRRRRGCLRIDRK